MIACSAMLFRDWWRIPTPYGYVELELDEPGNAPTDELELDETANVLDVLTYGIENRDPRITNAIVELYAQAHPERFPPGLALSSLSVRDIDSLRPSLIRYLEHQVAAGTIRLYEDDVAITQIDVIEPIARSAAIPRTTWIEFQLVWAGTEEGVGGVGFSVTLPNGRKMPMATKSDGVARIESIDAGVCDLETTLQNVHLENALVVAATRSKDQGLVDRPRERPASNASMYLVEMEEYKVKTGDTIDSIARKARLSWQRLALFNWGTCEPSEINRYLFAEVGCRKRTRQGNYVFDDADDPGVLQIPRPWRRYSLATAARHVFAINRAPLPVRALFVRIQTHPEDAKHWDERVRLSSVDGSFEEFKTVADDLLEGDAFIDLLFCSVPTRLSYDLEIVLPSGKVNPILTNVPFVDLHHESPPEREPAASEGLNLP